MLYFSEIIKIYIIITTILIIKIKNLNLTNNTDTSILDYKKCKITINFELEKNINYEDFEYKYINYSLYEKDKYYLLDPKNLNNPLNLSDCKNEGINISVSEIVKYLNVSRGYRDDVLQFLKDGHDIFNRYSPLYHNICYSFSYLNESDLTLYDRRAYLLTKFAYICGDCDYEGIDETNNQILCFCKNESDIENKTKIEQIIDGLKELTNFDNFQILQCYKLAISKEGQKNNYFSEILKIYIIITTILIIKIENIFKEFNKLTIFYRDYNIINNNMNIVENKNCCQQFLLNLWSIFKSDYDLFNIFEFNSLNYYKEDQIYSIKIMIYLNSLIISLVSNIFFYTDDTMHKIYINNGEYSIIYQIPSIIFSNILSSLLSIFLKN